MRRAIAAVIALFALTACGTEYDPELCSLWTDMYNLNQSGDSRVQMDRYCER